MSGYILMTEDCQYVESVDIENKTVDVSPVRKDAWIFQRREVADQMVQEIKSIGCFVKTI